MLPKFALMIMHAVFVILKMSTQYKYMTLKG